MIVVSYGFSGVLVWFLFLRVSFAWAVVTGRLDNDGLVAYSCSV